MKKTILGIESTGSHKSFNGDWRVYGKLTGKVYTRGTKYDCTWKISINPQWYKEEEEEAQRDKEEREYYKNNPTAW